MLDEDRNYYIDGTEIIELTDRETELLSILLRNKGKVITYDILFYPYYMNKSTVINLLYNIRKKLNGKVKIRTVRGVGLIID